MFTPKKAHFRYFHMQDKDSSDDLGNHWAIEQKHFVSLIWGERNLQTSLDAISKISKYLMGTDSRRRPLNTSTFYFVNHYSSNVKLKHRRSHGNIFQGLPNSSLSMDSKIVLWKSDQFFPPIVFYYV